MRVITNATPEYSTEFPSHVQMMPSWNVTNVVPVFGELSEGAKTQRWLALKSIELGGGLRRREQ